MSNGLIQLGKGHPEREVLKAASDLLNAVIAQYPRAAEEMKPGVQIVIVTPKGPLLTIAGQAGPAARIPGLNGGIVG